MDVEKAIRDSDWWRRASEMADRHCPPETDMTLADHLTAVHDNLRWLAVPTEGEQYRSRLLQSLRGEGFDPADLLDMLTPVALLHDIGKCDEDKEQEVKHPLTGKNVPRRHPVVGVIAAMQILPQDLLRREMVLALISEHDTPYSWYVQYKRSGAAPSAKAWARLDRKIDSREDGTGILMLTLFKLADIDGHQDVEDACWFVEMANYAYLHGKGNWLPVPTAQDIAGTSSSIS